MYVIVFYGHIYAQVHCATNIAAHYFVLFLRKLRFLCLQFLSLEQVIYEFCICCVLQLFHYFSLPFSI